jgi:hypothetical protein
MDGNSCRFNWVAPYLIIYHPLFIERAERDRCLRVAWNRDFTQSAEHRGSE